MLAGDLCDVGVGIYVPLYNQLPSLFGYGAKVIGLSGLLGKVIGEGLNALKQTKG
jgi:hypothetical protein